MTWRNRAACLDEDPELFFPIGNTGPALLQIEEAKAVCRRCEVVETCLKWAIGIRPGRRSLGWPVRGRAPRPQTTQCSGPSRRLTYPPSLTDSTDLIDRSRATNRTVVPCGFALLQVIRPRSSCTRDVTIWVPRLDAAGSNPVGRPDPSSVTVTVKSSS